MPRNGGGPFGVDRQTTWSLLLTGLRRSPWQTAAALLVALVAAGAVFGSALLFTGMDRVLKAGMDRLGADLILTPPGAAAVARQLLTDGQAEPLAPTIPVATWQERLTAGQVVGVVEVRGWDLTHGGAGSPTAAEASLLMIRLERWASPLVAVQEVSAAIPEAEVVVAEQATRQVTQHLQPMVRYGGIGAAVTLLAAVLLTGLLTGIRVGERRPELGMMRAMGATRAFLLRLTLAEAGVPALLGALGGVLVTGAVLAGTGVPAIRLLEPGEVLLFGFGSVVLVLVTTLLAALGPALRAARLDPLSAILQDR